MVASAAFVLFEGASGYALFEVMALDELALGAAPVQQAVQDLARFSKVGSGPPPPHLPRDARGWGAGRRGAGHRSLRAGATDPLDPASPPPAPTSVRSWAHTTASNNNRDIHHRISHSDRAALSTTTTLLRAWHGIL